MNGLIKGISSVPQVLVEGLKAVGNLGSLGSGGNPYAVREPTAGKDDVAIQESQQIAKNNDPTYLQAGQVQTVLEQFRQTIRENLREAVSDPESLFHDALRQVEVLKKRLDDVGTEISMAACANILDPLLKIGDEAKMASQEAGDEATVSEIVTRLDTRFEAPAAAALTLKVKADSQPGLGFGAGAALLPSMRRRLQQGDVVDTMALLEKKQQHMLTMQATMEAQIRNYDEKTRTLLETEETMISLVNRFNELESSKAKLGQARQVLREAIEYVSALQSEIMSLADYFHQISTGIETLVEVRCTSFLDTLKSLPPMVSEDDTLDAVVDYKAQELFTSLLTIRGHFGAVYGNAAFYRRVNDNYITKALRLVCRIPVSAGIEQQNLKLDELRDITSNAAREIQAIGREQRQKLLDSLQPKMKQIDADLRKMGVLSVAAKAKQKLVKDAVREVEEEQKEEITEAANKFNYELAQTKDRIVLSDMP